MKFIILLAVLSTLVLCASSQRRSGASDGQNQGVEGASTSRSFGTADVKSNSTRPNLDMQHHTKDKKHHGNKNSKPNEAGEPAVTARTRQMRAQDSPVTQEQMKKKKGGKRSKSTTAAP